MLDLHNFCYNKLKTKDWHSLIVEDMHTIRRLYGEDSYKSQQ